MSGTLAAVLAAGSAGSLSAESLADALVKAYQTSPLLESSRAALRSLDESVPQARADKRPQVGASVDASSGIEVEDIEEKISSIQAALNASLLVYDHGQTRAAVESARHQHRLRPRRPDRHRAAGAVQRGAGLRRRAPRPGVRPAGAATTSTG